MYIQIMHRTLSSLSHSPWLHGKHRFKANERIAIVGYSHHFGPDDNDRENFTTDVLSDVVSGHKSHAFFESIAGYFNEPSTSFWKDVDFFNFLPRCIGPSEQKYGAGSRSVIETAQRRVCEILAHAKPNKVFVFTKKGWANFPDTLEEREKRPLNELIAGQKEPSWGTYESDEHKIRVCGFRHPQFARKELLRDQVSRFYELP